MPITRKRLRIQGRVQGVFFRASAREQAQRLGLTGWVRNLSDGSVEVAAQGPKAQVDQLVAWSRRGPRQARVDGVEVATESPQEGEHSFRVRY
jgi:acylphosphatase